MKWIGFRSQRGIRFACIAMAACALPVTIFAASKPVTNSCSASPESVYPGDPVTVTCSALNLKQKKHVTYAWSATGGSISGTIITGTVNTAGLAAGSYTVTENISEGKKPTQSADANASFTVKDFDPPTVSCSASPTSVQAGLSATIVAQASSPQHRPLSYSFLASSGQIASKMNRATLNTADIAPGIVTINCKATDDQAHTSTALTVVTVHSLPPPPTPKIIALCVVPSRGVSEVLDQDAKNCLDIVALNLQRNPDAGAVLIAHTAPDERNISKQIAQRCVSARTYLVEQKNIDSARVDLRTSDAKGPSIQSYLVPAGANFDSDQPASAELDPTLSAAKKARKPKASK